MSGEDHFIQEATEEHKGRLRRYAKRHRALNEDGTIDLAKVSEAANRERNPKSRLQRLREINLARTLRKLDR